MFFMVFLLVPVRDGQDDGSHPEQWIVLPVRFGIIEFRNEPEARMNTDAPVLGDVENETDVNIGIQGYQGLVLTEFHIADARTQRNRQIEFPLDRIIGHFEEQWYDRKQRIADRIVEIVSEFSSQRKGIRGETFKAQAEITARIQFRGTIPDPIP